MIPWFEVPVIRVGGLAVEIPDALAVTGAIAAMSLVRRVAEQAGVAAEPVLGSFVW